MNGLPIRICSIPVLLCAVSGLLAADLETQNVFEVSVPVSGRTELIAHSQVRTADYLRDLFQVRGGAIVNYRLRPRLTLIGGDYYVEDEAPRRWRATNRLFGGIGLAFRRKVTIETRTLAERHFRIEGPDYWRLRQRVRVVLPLRLSPYFSAEYLTRVRRLDSGRFLAGIRPSLGENLQFELAGGYYLYAMPGDSPAYVIFTAVRYRFHKKG